MKKNVVSALLVMACFTGFAQDSKNKPFVASGKKIKVFTTAENTSLRLSPTSGSEFRPAKQPLENEVSVFEVFAKLSKQQQKEFLDAYYSREKGIGYSLIRTTIHSSDFSSASYTYVNENDKDLKSFSIDHDKKYRIPLIKDAMKTAGKEMTLYASPWSPPAFMKDTKSMLKGGKLAPEFYQPWANYYVKFIQAYEKEGIPIWGITVQNEPMATQTWESCIFTAAEERDFLKNT